MMREEGMKKSVIVASVTYHGQGPLTKLYPIFTLIYRHSSSPSRKPRRGLYAQITTV